MIERFWRLDTNVGTYITITDPETAAMIERYCVERPIGPLIFRDTVGNRQVLTRNAIGHLSEVTRAGAERLWAMDRELKQHRDDWEATHPEPWSPTHDDDEDGA